MRCQQAGSGLEVVPAELPVSKVHVRGTLVMPAQSVVNVLVALSKRLPSQGATTYHVYVLEGVRPVR